MRNFVKAVWQFYFYLFWPQWGKHRENRQSNANR